MSLGNTLRSVVPYVVVPFMSAVAWALCTGCNPAYSSPVRVFNNTPPGRMEHQTIEVSAAGTTPPGATLSLGYAPWDWAKIRLGGDFAQNRYGTTSLGLHVSLWPAVWQRHRVKFLNEIELGFGGGVGGACDQEVQYCRQWSEKSWQDHLLLGMWTGAGVGIGIDIPRQKGLVWDLEMDLYFRARFQYADATYAPATMWYTYGPGIAFRMQRFLRLYFAWALAHYENDVDADGEMGFELGLSFTFDLIPQKRTRIEQHW